MEPWEQEWYHSRALERRAVRRPCCCVCGEVLDQFEALIYEGRCRYCAGEAEDE